MNERDVIRIGRRSVWAECTAASPGGDTFLFFLAREFDDQNGVLGSQADENHEADLGQNVDGHASRKQACNGGQQAHRDDQDDR